LDAYDLRDKVRHNQGSYFAIMADTIARFENGKPILYYTWTPMWVGGVLVPGKDVVWLSVPFTSLPDGRVDVNTKLPDGRNSGFAINKIQILANKKFLNANPAARRFFEQLKVSIDDISAQNIRMRKGEKKPEDVRRHVEEWIAAHRAEFDSWIKESIKAAQ
jgi:glycine betaine/proline transport system substrate-binding protein